MSATLAKKSDRAPEVGTDDFRAALEGALERAAEDERISPLLRAAGLRMRFEFPDVDLILNVATAEDGGARLVWSFSDDVDWQPKLELTMDSAVANRYLQGRESLAIALARGEARCRGESRTALLYLPATRLLCEPYRKVVEAGFPALAA